MKKSNNKSEVSTPRPSREGLGEGLLLSPNFTLAELTRSRSHPEIDNTPPLKVVVNLVRLAIYILQPLRNSLKRPVIINSGYRCPELNKAVGGVANSYHLTGQAADIAVKSDEEGKAIFDILKQNPFVDVALYEHSRKTKSQWIHVQWSQKPRRHFNATYAV